MNKTEQAKFINNLKRIKAFTRLKKVTTMLPPPRLYTNRYQHTEDVYDVASKLSNTIIPLYENRKMYNFEEACYVHDIGHCCFAHEAEQTINSFIAKQLCVTEEEVCFSHAINGALVFAIAAKPKRKVSAFSKMNLYDNHPKDMPMIVDSIIKHSFKDYYVNSIYLNYINEEYKKITKQSLLKNTKDDEKPLYKTGYYVRVADDIASKNSDTIDLMNHYYGLTISKVSHPNRYWNLADKYIQLLDDFIEPVKNKFCIEEVYENLDFLQKQKALLKTTYKFKYKKEITTKMQQVLLEILNILADNPRILRKYFSRKFAYIERNFNEDIKCLPLNKGLNNFNLRTVKNSFYADPYNKANPYYRVYHRFICSLVYQISNFTDKDLVDFAYNMQNNLSASSKACVSYLKTIY